MTSDDQPIQSVRRDWLAALLLRRPEGFLARFAAGAARLRALPRGLRRQLQRKAAAAALGAALVFGLAGGAFLTPTVHAATINVDDGIVYMDDDDGFCSLFEAINNANNDNQYSSNTGECESGAVGLDTINLPLNGNFVLSEDYVNAYSADNGLPVISSTITIEGNGSTIARDTGDSTPMFRIMAVNSDGDLTLNDVAISGGEAELAGGAIYVYEGKLTINDSTISDNYAETDGGGILVVGSTHTAELTIHNSLITRNESGMSDGGGLSLAENSKATITDSTISYNYAYNDSGGGIYAYNSTLDIFSSIISHNGAEDGGGLYLYESTTTIIDSVISDNNAQGEGGGINSHYGTLDMSGSTISGNYSEDGGGGVYVDGEDSVVTITNSTISDNTTNFRGGGIYLDEGQLTLNNITITANSAPNNVGGGIFKYYEEATLTLNRSLVSGNTAAFGGAEIHIHNGTASSDNYNVLGHSGLTTAEAFSSFYTGSSDVRATSNGTDPTALTAILDTTLANNGGPTQTHNLVLGSPALDIAPDADCAADPVSGVDQRGETRPFDVPGQGKNGGAATCDVGAVEFRPPAPVESAIYMSAKKSGSADGEDFDNSDILKWDGTNWSKIFDGTNAHLDPVNKPKHNINAFWVDPDTDDIIMSFAQNGRKVGLLPAKVDGMDLVRWDGSSFSLWFDGSDVGLTKKTPEKIDALHVLPKEAAPPEFNNACEQYLLISTQGNGAVPAYGGGQIKFGGEDILGFCLTNWGDDTDGFWHMALDGSAVGLPKNSLDSISTDPTGEVLYFTTSKPVVLGTPPNTVSGGHSMVYAYDTTTGEFTGPHFIAADEGLGEMVDGLHVEGELE